jgi:hypothetical protein
MNEATKTSEMAKAQSESNAGSGILNILLGIWLIISPFAIVSFNPFQNATVNNVIVGILVAIVAAIRFAGPTKGGWSWCNVILGAWLIISPFVLGFSNAPLPTWHNIIVGIVVGLLALSRAFVPRSRPVTHPM